jgi:hypothetical protein
MTRWTLLVLGLLAAPGCVELDVWLKDKKSADPPPLVTSPRPRVLVNAGDVNERNARDMAEALRDELDRAEFDNRPVPSLPSADAKKK